MEGKDHRVLFSFNTIKKIYFFLKIEQWGEYSSGFLNAFIQQIFVEPFQVLCWMLGLK